MQPSVNYDYLIHDGHIHWCNVEEHGMARCEELAIGEHSATSATNPLADVGLSLVIAMMITFVAGLIWGVRHRAAVSARRMPEAKVMSQALEVAA